MAKKEVQVFGMSFLDLLSGALAAVIILFIIVPKMDMQSKDAVKAMDELGIEVDGLAEKLKQLENSVDKELFKEIMEQLEAVQDALSDAQQQVEKLEEIVETLEAQIEELIKYKEWMDNCGFGLNDTCPPKTCPEPPQTTFMAISVSWQNEGVFDVDLWVQTPGGRVFYYDENTHSGHPGILSVDSKVGPGVELFEILNPPPGEYKIYLNLFTGSSATASVRVFYQKGVREFKNNQLRGPYQGKNLNDMRLIQRIVVKADGEFEFYD